MPFILLNPRTLDAVQAEQAALFGAKAGQKEATLIKLMHARAQTLSEHPATDLASLAAVYGYALAHDHLYQGANLSVALMAIELFLSLNSHALGADDTTCFLGLMVVANGELGEDAFASWIRNHLKAA